jgi:hypothetical protein
MKIALVVEGKTEKVFLPHLKRFLEARLEGRMPRIDPLSYDGRIPTGGKLRRLVEGLLRDGADHVIALTDVHTGRRPPEFENAKDAAAKMRDWVGDEPRFHPHAAQHDFEAWLLPYWPTIQRLAGSKKSSPKGSPEQVNHDKPPAHRIQEIFRTGNKGKAYVKPRDAGRILKDNDLSVAVSQCLELKALVNTLMELCGGERIR